MVIMRSCLGECAVCNSDDVEYGVLVQESGQVYYPIHCNKCGSDGKEWYELEYVETIVQKEECVK